MSKLLVGVAMLAWVNTAFGQVEPLHVGETSLPQTLVASAQKLIGTVIPDPRGGEFRKFYYGQATTVEGNRTEIERIGWVMPAKGAGVRYGITLSGAVYPVSRVGDLVAVADALANANESLTYERGATQSTIRVLSLLVCSGNLREAESVITRNQQYPESFSTRSVANSFLYAQLEGIGNFASYGYWQDALATAKIAKISMYESGRSFPFFEDDVSIDMIVDDLEKRIAEGQKCLSINEIVDVDKELERKKIVQSFRYQVINDPDQESLRLEYIMQEHGEKLIPLLIEEYRTNDWLIYDQAGIPRMARLSILRAVAVAWDGLPLLKTLSQKQNNIETANYLVKEWDAQKNLSVPQRHLRWLGNNDIEDWDINGSLDTLLKMGTGGAIGYHYRPGHAPILLEQLSDNERKQLTEILENRLARFGDIRSKRTDFSIATKMAIGLTYLKGRGALPILRRMSSEMIAIAPTVSNWGGSWFDRMIGAVISQRIALGDVKNALIDYKIIMSEFKPEFMGVVDCLRIGWEFPENVEVQKTVGALLADIVKKYYHTNLKGSGTDGYSDVFGTNSGQLLLSPGAKLEIARLLSDFTVVGKIVAGNEPSTHTLKYIVSGSERSAGLEYGMKEEVIEPGTEANLEVGDVIFNLVMHQLNNYNPRFYFSPELRHRERMRFKNLLLDSDLDWRQYLVRWTQSNELPIYRE